MPSDYTTEAGRVEDMEGAPLVVTVDYDSLIIGATSLHPGHRLSLTQCEEFAGVFVAACWQAGRNAERMAAEMIESGKARRVTCKTCGRSWRELDDGSDGEDNVTCTCSTSQRWVIES